MLTGSDRAQRSVSRTMTGENRDPGLLPPELAPNAPDADVSRRWPARLLRVVAGLALAGTVVLGAGFFVFVNGLSRQESEFGRRVDGIAALTGGADRIGDALSVLREGRAQRLLITGVNAAVSDQTLIRAIGSADLFACCVDIGRDALNTVGNAQETAHWVARHGYRSVMVVTSNYHMPRALVELRRHLKDVEFIPHPVMSDSVRIEGWWQDTGLFRLLFMEFAKYLAAEVRSRLVPDNPARP